MRFLGLTISRSKEKSLAPVPQGGGLWRVISEPFTGAWQRNMELKTDTVLTNPTVFSCVTLIAGDIAKCHVRLVQLGADGIWTEQESPSYSPVLRKPNRYQTRAQFFEQWMISKLCWGNTYVLKERDNRNIVTALYVLDPRRVRVLVAGNGDVFYEVSRDDLSGQHAETVTVPASEIIHDRMNAIFHPLVGLPPIFAAGYPAAQGLKIINNSATFFANGARPSGLLVAPGEISDENARELKAYWETEFAGENTGKIAVLSDGLSYVPMAMSSVDSQLIEQLRWTAETVCGCFHVPAYMVGVGTAPLNNNVETQKQLYYAQCLQKHIEAIEALLDEGLGLYPATNGSQPLGTEFDLDDLLRMDMATLVKTYGDATQRGMTVNEFRKKLNLRPTEGGDVPYLQEQMWPISQLAERPMPAQAAPLALPSPDDVPAEEAPEVEPEDETRSLEAAIRMKFAGEVYAA